MSALESLLGQLENRLQTLIEGSLQRIFSLYSIETELAQHLVAAMQAELRPLPDGGAMAPDLFTIFLPAGQPNPQDEPATEVMLAELADRLQQTSAEINIQFANPPVIRMLLNPETDLSEPVVVAQFSLSEDSHTANVTRRLDEPSPSAQIPLPGAFLIVDGLRLMPVTQSITNIGSQAGNHLVIEDQRVAHLHAQLRYTQGSFMIFDLGSSGGTFVNGQRITHCQLLTGDVISLAGLPIVFGLEGVDADSETQDLGNLGEKPLG